MITQCLVFRILGLILFRKEVRKVLRSFLISLTKGFLKVWKVIGILILLIFKRFVFRFRSKLKKSLSKQQLFRIEIVFLIS